MLSLFWAQVWECDGGFPIDLAPPGWCVYLVLLPEKRMNKNVCAWGQGAGGRLGTADGKGVQEALPQLCQGK